MLIRRPFNKKELLQLLTNNLNWIMYYDSELCQLGTLKEATKQLLLSVKAIQVGIHYPDSNIRFLQLYPNYKRATPEMYKKSELALLLHCAFNEQIPVYDWLSLNFYRTYKSRQTTFIIRKLKCLKVGMNVNYNRFLKLNVIIILG